MTRAVVIEPVENGFTLTIPVDDGTDEQDTVLVFEADEDAEFGELHAAKRLLWALIEHLGLYGGEYDKERLRVVIEPGDKYEPPAPEPNPPKVRYKRGDE